MHSIYFITTKFHIFLKISFNYQIIRPIFTRNQKTKNILELVIFQIKKIPEFMSLLC